MLKGDSPRKQELPAIWNRRGSALPVVMLVILVLSLLGSGLLSLTLGEGRGAANDVQINQATYLAEAGINLALANLRRDPGWRAGLANLQLTDRGRLERVTVTDKPLSLRLQAYAEVNGIRRTVFADVARPLTSYALAAGSGQGDLWETPLLTIKGDILYLGNLTVTLQKIEGNAAASGNFTNLAGTITGQVIAGRNLINYGSIKGKAYYGGSYYGYPSDQPAERASLAFPQGITDPALPYRAGIPLTRDEYNLNELQDIIASQPGDIKVLYREGNLVINGSDTTTYSGKAIIAASGSITLKTDLQAGPDSAWALVAGGNFYVGDFWDLFKKFSVQGIIICGGTFSTSQLISFLNITGSLVTRDINTFLSSLQITWDSRFNGPLSSKLRAGGWEILAWGDTTPY